MNQNRRVSVSANAKLNLTLNIAGRRENGYHDVEMIMQPVDLCDTVTVAFSGDGKISILPGAPGLPEGNDNSAVKAAELFFEYTKISNPGIRIEINKTIPVAAGLAGGSADAAGTLTALNALFSAGLTQDELMKIGLGIGADVPFCLAGSTMLATGVGERLMPLNAMPHCFIVIAKPDEKVSTALAYARFDETGVKTAADTKKMAAMLEAGNLNGIADCLCNVFEEVINLKSVFKLKQEMLRMGALGAAMSGSGPSVFGIFDNEAFAGKCLKELKNSYSEVYLCLPAGEGCTIKENIAI